MNQERQKIDAIADAVEIPEGATHYIMQNNMLLYYLKQEDNQWKVWFSYDSISGWGYADTKTIENNFDQLKPL